MNMNFVRKPIDYTDELFSELKVRAAELKNQEIIKMLNDTWRPSKVAAWMIGVGDKRDLEIELIRYLNIPGNHYCEHVLFNYYLIKDENSSIEIKKFISRQIEFIISSKKPFLDVERISIHWAIAILKHIDKVYSTKNEREIKTSTLWSKLLATVNELKTSEHILKMYESNYYIETIEESLNRVKN